jgi:hypothetical protein
MGHKIKMKFKEVRCVYIKLSSIIIIITIIITINKIGATETTSKSFRKIREQHSRKP